MAQTHSGNNSLLNQLVILEGTKPDLTLPPKFTMTDVEDQCQNFPCRIDYIYIRTHIINLSIEKGLCLHHTQNAILKQNSHKYSVNRLYYAQYVGWSLKCQINTIP